MSVNYYEKLTNIVNSYIVKESLCMLLLASSILFYNMAKKHNDKIPKPYALSIAILLILYSAILGLHSGFEFSFSMNNFISNCKKTKCKVDIEHFENIQKFYTYMGVIHASILIFISYVLICFN
jgi:hypothetical protein